MLRSVRTLILSTSTENALLAPPCLTINGRRAGKLTLSALVSAFVLAWCVMVAPSLVQAQDVRNPQSAIDNRARTDLRVDPISHALQFQIPLGQYAGRAGASLPITLNYSSKVWNIKYANTIQCQDDPGSLYFAEYAKSSASGWTSSLDWFTWTEDLSLEIYDAYTSKPTNRGTVLNKIARMHVTLPDGSRHELRKDDNFHAYDENITGLFYSVDGSRLIYDTMTHTLYLPDGSRYVADWSTGVPTAETYIDRNGNQLSYSYSTRQWTDTLGRIIGLPPLNASTEQDYTYSMPGVGGTSLTYTLRWKQLSSPGVINEQETDQTLRYKGDRTTNCQTGTDYSGLFHSAEADYNGIIKSTIFNPVVLSQIILPNGQSYTFKYNIYGEITKVIYPTGGYERFAFGGAPLLSAEDGIGLYQQANRGVTDAWISKDGTSANEVHWTYSGFSTIAPDGTRTDRSVFTNSQDWSAYGFEDPRLGMVYDERTYSSTGQMLRRKLTDYAVDGQAVQYAGYWAYKQRNPRPTKEVGILLDTGGNALTVTTTYEYDADLNQTVVRHYDFASVDQTTAQTGAISAMPVGTLLRTDEMTYLVNDPNYAGVQAAYRARNLVTLPTIMRVHQGDVNGQVASETHLSYDESAVSSEPNIINWIDPSTTYRGNVTTMSHWLDTTNSYLSTHVAYDQAGNAVSATDALGNTATTSYADSFSDNVNRNTYALPTSTTTPIPDSTGHGSNAAFTTSSIYDYSTGLVISTTDANGKVTTSDYTDPLNRLKQVTRPDGGRTQYFYNDAVGNLYIRTLTDEDASRSIEAYQFFDGLGRGVRTFLNVGGAPVQFITTDTQYDALGRVWRTSNHYLTGGSNDPVNPSGNWTTTTYDALGRTVSITTPDGATVTTAYSGNAVTVTDQAGKARKSVTDALGRLTAVDEDPAGLNYQTSYLSDVLGNLRQVTQGTQQRFFMYDSLLRLIRAKNPEQTANGSLTLTDAMTGNTQWSMAYAYDANGNLTSKTDARNLTTAYTYDHLNRNITIDYSNTTNNPDINRYYDNGATNANGKGRYWFDNYQKDDGHIEQQATDFYDAVGRAYVRRQNFYAGGVWYGYQVSRTFDKAGHVTSETYPSGHTVNYNYDAAGRLGDNGTNLAFTGNLGDGVTRTYATAIRYDDASRLQQEGFGTQTLLYHKLHYNVRGQLYDIRLSTVPFSASTNDQWDWNRGAIVNYYDQNCQWGVSDTTNNGNLKCSEYAIPLDPNGTYTYGNIGSYATSLESYTYDSLNRLTSDNEQKYQTGGALIQVFKQSYAYDRWGNRTIDQANTSGLPVTQFAVDPNGTNRLVVPSGQTGTMAYDDAGNLTTNTYNPPTSGAANFFYDAENRMIEVQNGSNQTLDKYGYDADGHRVRRTVSSVDMWQVYGLDGELLAEYGVGAAATAPQKEYGYRNGELLVTAKAPASLQALFVVGSTTLNGGDSAVKTELEGMGFTVTVKDATSAVAADANGKTLVLISETVQSTNVNTKFRDVTVPVVVMEPALYDDMDLTGPTVGTDYDNQAGQTQVTITDSTHPMAAGLTGTVTVTTTAMPFAWGRPAASAAKVASLAIDSNRFALFGYESGATMVGLTAPARRVGIFLWEDTPTALNSNGWALFDAAVRWCANLNPPNTNVQWLVSDQLGTPRMVVDQTGSLSGIKRHDYLPFGEEIGAGVGGRTTGQGYGQVDNVRQHFTGHERDIETGLDYSKARYYASTLGRFTSPDPLLSSGSPTHPQSWNRYTYCLNHPLVLIDPDGLIWGTYEKDGVTHLHWYDTQKELEAAGATAYTGSLIYQTASGWISLSPNSGQWTRSYTEYDAKRAYWRYTGLPSSWQDWVPVWGQVRRMAFNIATENYEGAVGNFFMASVDGGTMGAGIVGGVGRQAATEAAEEGILRLAESETTSTLVEQPNRIYSARVLLRSAEETGPYHNFPESFNEQIFSQGDRTVTRNFFNVDRQGLSNDSMMYRLRGSINGRTGTFEIGTRPSLSGRTEVIMHRFFNPDL